MTLPLPDPRVTQHSSEPVNGENVDQRLAPLGVQRNFEALAQALIDLRGLVFVGAGTPESVVTASPGAIYLNVSGGAGTTLYVKESGSATNTGWRAV